MKNTDPRIVRAKEVYESEKKRLSALFGVDLSKVSFIAKPKRGRNLGHARIRRWTEAFSEVHINTNYFENFESYNHVLNETITHELLHIVNALKNGFDYAVAHQHGSAWKTLMVQAGKAPNRTADVPAHSITKSTWVNIRCKCGKEFTITKKRWGMRERYSHKECGNSLFHAVLVK